MSDILASMVTFLQTDAALTALVATRIYPEKLPPATTSTPNTFPALTYQLIDEPAAITHDRRTVYKARVQADAWGTSYKSAHAVADALHDLLHGFRGSWSPFTVGNVLRKRKNDLPEPDLGLERVSMDFVISYSEEP